MNQHVRISKNTPNVGALDFSWLLDAPAGKHGFVKVKEGHLFYEDGTRAKFVGFNFPARANMPDHETADKISAKLATLGVNVVRLHATDAPFGKQGWSANPDSPLINYHMGNSRSFYEEGLDRFDYWVSKLREKGIYLHVDLLVGRAFKDGDDLDYPDSPPVHIKSSTHVNQRLIDLQKEFATKYLCHVNPYTKMALIDDPAVMTIQIVNEDSIFFDAERSRHFSGVKAYREEMQRRFNHYLLAKYNSRSNLAAAWTFEEQCALGEEEDPEKGTVRCIEIGDYYQPMNDPMGDWMAQVGPARYADFAEFGIMMNRKYYGEIVDHIRSLGSKVPIATTNLLTGAADVFSAADGDIMENNSYFNHPSAARNPEFLVIPDMREYVTSDPRTMTFPGFERRSNLTAQATAATVDGKPFIMSEWNEYGAHPFHSTAFLMTAAYGCLNDWDGLIVYCYHTCDRHDDQPADAVAHIMDAYNDPSLICQFGTMSAVFLKNMVRVAENKIDIVFTMNDLLTQPSPHRMPNSILPFISKIRTVFLNQGDQYTGKADVAVSAGFVSTGNYDEAEHAVIYAHSPYRDALRHSYAGDAYLQHYVDASSNDVLGAAALNDKYLVFPDIDAVTKNDDYTVFAKAVDVAMKNWGLVGPDRGIAEEDAIISDTGELVFNPGKAFFQINTNGFVLFSGEPKDTIRLGRRYLATSQNQRITMSLLPLDGNEVARSKHLLFTALGKTGMDETKFEPIGDNGDMKVTMAGKLYLDALEGSLVITDCTDAVLWVLDTYGNRQKKVMGVSNAQGGVEFVFDGGWNTGNYELIL